MGWKDRISFTAAKLSTIMLMSIGAALVAVFFYTDGGALAAWGLSSRQYLWVPFAGAGPHARRPDVTGNNSPLPAKYV